MACFFPEGLGLSRLLGKVFLFGRALVLGRDVKTPPFCGGEEAYSAVFSFFQYFCQRAIPCAKLTGFVTPITKWAVCGLSTTTQCKDLCVGGVNATRWLSVTCTVTEGGPSIAFGHSTTSGSSSRHRIFTIDGSRTDFLVF